MFPEQQFPLGSGPQAGKSLDINNDGRSDVLVVNYNSGDLSVALGAPLPAMFAPPLQYPAIAKASALATGDFDNDGKADAAVVSDNSPQQIVTLKGNGLGAFGSPVNSAILTNPISVFAADFNIDGKLDVAVGNGSTIQIDLGDGTGSFSPLNTFVSGASIFALTGGDVDADGVLDLVAGHAASTTGIVYKGSGGGSFTTMATLTQPTGPFDVVIADLNHDNKPDIVFSNYGNAFAFTAYVTVFINNGGAFASGASYSAGNRARALAAADIDGDSHVDVAVVNDFENNSLRIFRGDGTGALSLSQILATAKSPRDVMIGEFTGDGVADVISVNFEANSFTTYAGRGAAGVAPTIAANFHGNAMTTIDLNEDGHVDVLTVGNFASPKYFKGDSAGHFTETPIANYAANAQAVTAVDLTNDQNADIAITIYDSGTGNGKIGIIKNNGGGSFSTMPLISYQFALRPIALGDINADGKSDVVAGISTQFTTVDGLYWRLGDGTGAFAHPSTILFGDNPMAVELDDYNQDGRLDVATPNAGSGHVAIYINNGLGGFAAPATVAVGNSPVCAHRTDLNADGNVDLIVYNFLSPSISILSGNGTGGFSVVTIPAGMSGYEGFIADLTQDGLTDFLVNGGSQGVGVFQGGPAGNFNYLARYGSMGLGAATDINSDGRTDLITGGFPDFNYTGSRVLLNELPAPAGIATLGAGTPGCQGHAGISVNSPANVNNSAFALLFTNAPPSSLGLCVVTDTVLGAEAPDPFGFGVLFILDFINTTEFFGLDVAVDGSGAGIAPIAVPNSPSLVSNHYYAQGLFLEPPTRACSASPLNLITSACADITILP